MCVREINILRLHVVYCLQRFHMIQYTLHVDVKRTILNNGRIFTDISKDMCQHLYKLDRVAHYCLGLCAYK